MVQFEQCYEKEAQKRYLIQSEDQKRDPGRTKVSRGLKGVWEGLARMLGLKLGRCPCTVSSTGTFWRGNVKFSKRWWWGDED